MKNITVLALAFMFCGAASFAQQTEVIHVNFPPEMIVKIMAENNNRAYFQSQVYEADNTLKKDSSAFGGIRLFDVGAENAFISGKRHLDVEKFKKLQREYNGDLSEEAVNAKINKAFLKFTASKANHKKEYYKILADGLMRAQDVKEDILRNNGNVSFYDGSEFHDALGITATMDLYSKSDNLGAAVSSMDDDTDKVINHVELVLRAGERNVSAALIPSGSPCGCSVRVHEWRKSEGIAGNVFEAGELFRDNNAQLLERLKKAGAPNPCETHSFHN